MEDIVFVFGVMMVFIVFLLLLKIGARVLYYILFFPIIAGINKLLFHFLEKKDLNFQDTDTLAHYLLKYFAYTQFFIGWILIVIYSSITGYIFSYFTQSFVVMGVLSMIYFTYSFYTGKYKYNISTSEDIQDIIIEGVGEIDLSDLIDIDIDIDIS